MKNLPFELRGLSFIRDKSTELQLNYDFTTSTAALRAE